MQDLKQATSHYEQASAAQHEVPRMLHEAGKTEEIEHYVQRSSNKDLSRW
jgi:hypothetical protein